MPPPVILISDPIASDYLAIPPPPTGYEVPSALDTAASLSLLDQRAGVAPQDAAPKVTSICAADLDDFGHRVLGSGAFGAVYRAQWRGSDVAVKMITCADIGPEELSAFDREVNLLATIGHHPNIVRLMGANRHPPNLLIVMQLCENGSVFDYLVKKKTPVDYRRTLCIARDAAAGLYHLHSESVVHRDIAARNILLDLNLRAFVNDFGLSRSKDLALSSARTAQTLGPIKWMAPESLLEPGTYSFHTDVYSYGVFLYEITALQEPFPEATPAEVFCGIIQNKLSLVPSPSTEPFLAELIRHCLSFDPMKRPSMREIHQRLQFQISNLES